MATVSRSIEELHPDSIDTLLAFPEHHGKLFSINFYPQQSTQKIKKYWYTLGILGYSDILTKFSSINMYNIYI